MWRRLPVWPHQLVRCVIHKTSIVNCLVFRSVCILCPLESLREQLCVLTRTIRPGRPLSLRRTAKPCRPRSSLKLSIGWSQMALPSLRWTIRPSTRCIPSVSRCPSGCAPESHPPEANALNFQNGHKSNLYRQCLSGSEPSAGSHSLPNWMTRQHLPRNQRAPHAVGPHTLTPP